MLKIYSDPAAVGDIVSFNFNEDGSGVINTILPRKNIFSRKGKARNRKEDIIAANLDLITIIQAFKKPRLNLRFVDRLSVRSEKEKIPVLLCINKLDLADDKTIEYINNYYSNTKIKIIMTSALTGRGVEELHNFLNHKTSLFIGNSGVGKSSILNSINPDLNLRTSEVSERTNKGRHTTANVEMINFANDISIIDSPGMREFGLSDIDPNMLGMYFHEFGKYINKCSFKPCTHDHEPDCEIKKQVEKQVIFRDRYISYLNILSSLKEDNKQKYG
ncbi:MAG: ribosome small subunit-dependent GTPase A [Spirochaetes bacterium]|nr:ribosome small subunit-dependent GTPase A [Spirochaetota bacterium]